MARHSDGFNVKSHLENPIIIQPRVRDFCEDVVDQLGNHMKAYAMSIFFSVIRAPLGRRTVGGDSELEK
eukprot:1167200-Karenia_brevis.AAC.1